MNKEQWCPICGKTVFVKNAKKGEDLYCDECNKTLDQYKIKHFCDNPNCPNHMIELNDEKHYHDIESSCITVGSICGILKTHPYHMKKVIPISKTKAFIFKSTSYKVIEKTFHFCDICHGAIQFKEMNYEQFK